jgi:hypothetical protein
MTKDEAKEGKFVRTLKTHIEKSKKEDIRYCTKQDASNKKYNRIEMVRELFELLDKKYPG